MQNSNKERINNLKSSNTESLAKETSYTEEHLKEKASDTLLKTEVGILDVSEAVKQKELNENEKKQGSITERAIRWSTNPQLIQSNYGAFNAHTTNIPSTNYGLLLGVRITNTTFLRFGIRSLD